jgi:hypothetical protein
MKISEIIELLKTLNQDKEGTFMITARNCDPEFKSNKLERTITVQIKTLDESEIDDHVRRKNEALDLTGFDNDHPLMRQMKHDEIPQQIINEVKEAIRDKSRSVGPKTSEDLLHYEKKMANLIRDLYLNKIISFIY